MVNSNEIHQNEAFAMGLNELRKKGMVITAAENKACLFVLVGSSSR